MRVLLVAVALLGLPGAVAEGADVRALGGFFDPSSLDAVVGVPVTFVNDDSAAHTVTSAWDGGATFDEVLRAGETFTWTFREPGAWPVLCRPHAGMEMVVTAGAAAPEPAAQVPGFAVASLALSVVLGAWLRARRPRAP